MDELQQLTAELASSLKELAAMPKMLELGTQLEKYNTEHKASLAMTGFKKMGGQGDG